MESLLQRLRWFFPPQPTIHWRERPRRGKPDSALLLCTLVLLAIGLIALFSASYSTGLYRFGSATYFILRQVMWSALGVTAMFIISGLDYRMYGKYYKQIFLVALVLLVLVLIPGLGTAQNGARRWLFSFQPSELAKLAAVFLYAANISEDPGCVRHLGKLVQVSAAPIGSIAVLLILEPHTSATMIVVAIIGVMMIAGGMKWRYLTVLGAAVCVMLVTAYMTLEHVRERFTVWLNPFIDVQGDGYQGAMSQIAIGSGGIFGLGLGQGRQKHLYLPEPQNDFIFSSWCEEMGLIGALLVLALFALLIFRGYTIAQHAPDGFSALVAVGITSQLAIQTILNLCVISGLLPVTGASLPFFSYGGTALTMQLAEMGILLNISRYMRIDEKQQE